ncbi:MAG: M20/M25/M40 family metallo-hydrolase, partial [Gammaproteobacteria bacterium]|nr:M20/M25/M40 family metallo-hydrolase [Gammaproteobacteria bacterium]
AVERGPDAALTLDGEEIPLEDFVIPGFSISEKVSAPVVFAGWGIDSEEHNINDYDGIDVKGRIVLVRRFTPKDGVFEDAEIQQRLGDLRYKAFTAREHGALGLLVADLPIDAEDEEPPLLELRVDPKGNAGIPSAVIKRHWAEMMLNGGHHVSFTSDLTEHKQEISNIAGRLTAPQRLPGAVLLGAHYDHLGLGGQSSLAPGSNEPHNGADDNASGVAALLEAARVLASNQNKLSRDVVFVAFTGEEAGLLGSSQFTREPLPGTAPAGLVAMVNMDMVGRLRNNRVSILGSDSAEEWDEIVEPICNSLKISCQLGGDGYGPSDQMPFYTAGVPVLHLFTGAHEDYHKPSDDTALVNAAGGARVANLAASIALDLSKLDGLTYVTATAPPPAGDMRGYGASLGTIPDYTGSPDNRPGMLLSGVRPGGPADSAGLERGDRVIELDGREVRDIYDLMYILREKSPGEETTVIVERNGERIQKSVTFGESSRTR